MANATDATLGAVAIRFRQFCNWWTGELVAMLPLSLRPAAKFVRESTFIEFEGKHVQAKSYREGRMQSLGELDLGELSLAQQSLSLQAWLNHVVPDPLRLALVLPRGQVLSRRIELPPAAEQNLHQAIGYELNRYTPFKASEVYFDCRVLKRVPGQRELVVQLAVTPIASVDPLLALLAQAGVKPAAVVISDDLNAEHTPLNLLPPKRRPKAPPRISASTTVLIALALILFAVALALPLWQKKQAIAALTPLVEASKRDAEVASGLKKDLDTAVQTYDFLLQRKHAAPAATVVLEKLTRLLPDGTWLQQFSLRSHPKGWEIQIQGETTISSRLASVIEESPLFRDASFKSPLLKGQAPGSERFHLGAEVELAPPPKARVLADKQPSAAATIKEAEPPASVTTPPVNKSAPPAAAVKL